MPRRNNRRHRWPRSAWTTDRRTPDPTYRDMAQSLVDRGLASPWILDVPQRNHTNRKAAR